MTLIHMLSLSFQFFFNFVVTVRKKYSLELSFYYCLSLENIVFANTYWLSESEPLAGKSARSVESLFDVSCIYLNL